jgi:hypothetical protein
MQTPTLSLTLLILTAVHTVVGFPEGAPYEACASLKPRHGGINQIKPDGLTLVIQEEVNDTLREVTHYTPETTYKGWCKWFNIYIHSHTSTVCICVYRTHYMCRERSSSQHADY